MGRDAAEEIKELLAKATRAAYERGYNDAMARFHQITIEAINDGAIDPPTEAPQQSGARIVVHRGGGDLFARIRRGGRPNASGSAVLKTIIDNPGKTGAEVAQLCPAIHERTVRTALRRLRLAGKIIQAEGKWFEALL
jgi:hypothetical protein